MKDYQLDGNKEMVALGAMDGVGSMASCYVATGSFFRSAVNFMSVCETAVSNISMSCVVFLTLEFLTPLFKYTLSAILAAIIICCAWTYRCKFDFVAYLGAFLGVVFSSVEVTIFFAKILLQVTRPRTAILGKVPRTNVYRNILQYPEAAKVPVVLPILIMSRRDMIH